MNVQKEVRNYLVQYLEDENCRVPLLAEMWEASKKLVACSAAVAIL